MALKTNPTISVVLPVYNEGSHLGSLVNEVEASLADTSVRREYVLVDDGSRDDSWAQVKELALRFPVIAARFSRNFGKEYAVAAGLELATGDAVIVIDADGQHPASLIPQLINAW